MLDYMYDKHCIHGETVAVNTATATTLWPASLTRGCTHVESA
jgi:hypothetical protein